MAREDKELSLDIYALAKAMDDILGRVKERRQIVIPGEVIKVKDRMYELINRLRENESESFFVMCEAAGRKKVYIIALFLAILELLRLGVVSVYQDEQFADIRIYLREKEFDPAILENIEG